MGNFVWARLGQGLGLGCKVVEFGLRFRHLQAAGPVEGLGFKLMQCGANAIYGLLVAQLYGVGICVLWALHSGPKNLKAQLRMKSR